VTMRPFGTVVEIWRLKCWMHRCGHGRKMEKGKEKKRGKTREKKMERGRKSIKRKEKRE